jgi:large subunit ribosomal protein L1
MKRSKRFNAALEARDPGQVYEVAAGVAKVKEMASAKFDETVDIAVRLGVNPQHKEENIRGTVALPHGTGKSPRVLVLCDDSKAEEAQQAGAEFVGLDEYVQKIKDGWVDFDVAVATPNVMGEVGKLGRILGPRKLMPNPKTGTVTMDVGAAVTEIKAGKIDFRVDKAGVVHTAIGKVSFSVEALVDNINTFVANLVRLKPAAAKGRYLISVSLSSTMGPGVKLPATALAYQEKVAE